MSLCGDRPVVRLIACLFSQIFCFLGLFKLKIARCRFREPCRTGVFDRSAYGAGSALFQFRCKRAGLLQALKVLQMDERVVRLFVVADRKP